VNAVLESVHIKEGQLVKKGDLLFTLDARPFQAASNRRKRRWLATGRKKN